MNGKDRSLSNSVKLVKNSKNELTSPLLDLSSSQNIPNKNIQNQKMFSKRPSELNSNNINVRFKSLENNLNTNNHNSNSNIISDTSIINQIPYIHGKISLKPILIIPSANPQITSIPNMITTIKNNQTNNQMVLPKLTNSKSLKHFSYDKNSILFGSHEISQSRSLAIRIFVIYQRVDYPLLISPKTIVQLLREMISSLINLPIEKMELRHKQVNLMKAETNNINVYALVNTEMHPFFEVRKIRNPNSFQIIQTLHPMKYNNNVIIENIASVRELFTHIDAFYKNNLEEKDYFVEALSENRYSIGFAYKNQAFDFKRFLILLKSNDPLYENLKVELENEAEGSLKKDPKNESNTKSKKSNNNNCDVSFSLKSYSSSKNRILIDHNNQYYSNQKIALRKHLSKIKLSNCKRNNKLIIKKHKPKFLSMQ